MSGLEIENLSRTAQEAAAASEYVSVLKPRAENESIGLGNVKWLTVKLLFVKAKMLGNALGNGVSRHYIPNYFLLRSAP